MPNATIGTAVPDFGLAGVKTAGALFLLLAFIFLGFYLLKKYGHKFGLRPAQNKDLSLHSVISIGSKKSVVVVRFLNKFVLLGVTESQITRLAEQDADYEQRHPFSSSFSEELRSQDPD